MMHLWGPLHLLHPQALWLVWLLPLGWYLLARGDRDTRALSRLVDKTLLPHLLAGRRMRSRAPWWLFTLAMVLLVVAMAGPAWQQRPQPLYSRHAAQIVAMSMSPRMLVRDVTPDRLTRARYKVHALFDANRSGQNALVAYAGQAFVVAPLTSDAHALSDLLDALAPGTMPVPGNNAAGAIRRSVELLRNAGMQHGSLVLVTDSADAAAVAAARRASAHGVRVSVLGVGRAGHVAPVPDGHGGFVEDAQGHVMMASRQDKPLRALAAAGGGRYVPMTSDAADVRALAGQLRQGPTAQRAQDQARRRWIDEGPWFLLALLPLMALVFRRGWLLLCCVLLGPVWLQPAHAATHWRDLWLRRDQQAQQALRHGQPAQAQALARSPMLRGTAAYRAGHLTAAARAFKQAGGAQGLYNLGNTLARQGHYRQAIDAYDRALKLAPGDVDAKANRQALQDWLKKHKPPQHDGHGAQDHKHGGRGAQGSSQQQAAGKGQSSGRDTPGQGGQGQNRQASDGSRHKAQAGKDGSGADARQAQQQRQQAEQARQSMKRKMDQALQQGHASHPQHTPADNSFALGRQHAPDEGKHKALPAPLQQALERVPDDPGGLLRRKFMLEYERRQQSGHNTGDSDGGNNP